MTLDTYASAHAQHGICYTGHCPSIHLPAYHCLALYQLTMCIITGTLRSAPLPRLPVLSNTEPPPLRCKAAVDKLIEKADLHGRIGRYTTTCSYFREIACHHAGPSGQTLTQQTSSPSGEMNGSWLQWSIPL